ncbi:hypothetical protein KUTeg_000494, partial [Tegillarca granosa]
MARSISDVIQRYLGKHKGIKMKESNLSPPAPLDLGRMESEAKAAATKHISSLLQRPDQLEKVDQYKRRVTRKKASVDTMLKTAVQSQLDGVRTGLNQLQSALQDVYEIKQSLTDLETARDDLMFELHKQPQQSPTDNQRVLMSVRREPTLIVTALRIIEREERQEETGFLPPSRPKKWRDKCFKILQDSICHRIEGNQIEDRSINKMWLVRHLELIRQLMIDDLKVVKTLLPPIFPPDYDIVNKYVEMYHRSLSGHLQEMIAQELEGNDSPELMRHPELNIDTSKLGPLLENNVIDELQNQYLKNMKLNDWYRAEHPDADGDGYYSTSLPVIIFQMMEQNLQVAQMMGEDLVKKVVELFAIELKSFSTDYQGEIRTYKEEHMLDRGEPKFFLHYMIANTNNCLVFGEYLKQLRKRYLKEDYDQDEEEDNNIRKDRFQQLTDDFIKMGHAWTRIILDEVFIDLRDSKMQSGHSVEIICCTWADYSGDFVHLKPTFYVYDDRKNAAEKICREAEQLKDLFLKYGDENDFTVLQSLAEVFKLRDTSMMSLEIMGLIKNHPDIRMEQLINLLLCRGDMSRSEARQMVQDTMGGEEKLMPKPEGIFTEIATSMPTDLKDLFIGFIQADGMFLRKVGLKRHNFFFIYSKKTTGNIISSYNSSAIVNYVFFSFHFKKNAIMFKIHCLAPMEFYLIDLFFLTFFLSFFRP